MLTDDFFNENAETQETQSEEQQIVEKIKVGEKEYTQDELAQSVGLADKVRELETQWSTKIDRLMPEYTKKSQEVAEYRRKLEELEQTKVQQKQQEGGQLSPEEQAKAIRAELKKYGVLFQDEFSSTYAQQRRAEKLIDDANSLITQAAEDGKPKTTINELLQYMDENGIKNPNAAYKLKFEAELDDWKEKQIGKIKQPKMVTQTQSTAGSKAPAPVTVTKGNLSNVLSDFFGNQG